MTDRLRAVCSLIDGCETFADVGCDHGFCTLYALKEGKCRRAVITDISAKCLAKAEKLLADYIAAGKCVSVCCDGLPDTGEKIDEVLVAGMGGEEIIRILKNGYIPPKFILQPMKNAMELRAFLIERGCKITVDDMFKDGKYYFIIKGESIGGTYGYSRAELEYGRDSLKNPVFKEFAEREIAKRVQYLKECSQGESVKKISEEIALLKEVLQ